MSLPIWGEGSLSVTIVSVDGPKEEPPSSIYRLPFSGRVPSTFICDRLALVGDTDWLRLRCAGAWGPRARVLVTPGIRKRTTGWGRSSDGEESSSGGQEKEGDAFREGFVCVHEGTVLAKPIGLQFVSRAFGV